MVGWGLTHALQHRRLFPDASEPHTRLASGNLSLHFLLEIGGTAFLPGSMVKPEIEQGRLFEVADAPLIKHQIHAVYPVRSGWLELIERVLAQF
jgi:DNA-binding transcriptional LysR family regulator